MSFLLSSCILLLLCTINNASNNFTNFLNQVESSKDECSYNLSLMAAESNDLSCFIEYSCFYDLETNEFCHGHGECDFPTGTCICEREYGDENCGTKYVQYEIHPSVMSGMMILATILLIWSLGLMIWVHLYRDVGDVKAMSVVFTHLTLVGCAFICAGTIVIGIGYNDANCMILEWFQFLGINIVIACSLVKAYRIASIFGQSNFSPSDLTDGVLLKYFFIILSVDVFFLVIYTIFNFVEGGAYLRYLDDLTKETRCSSEPLTTLSYSLLVAWQLVLLIFVIKYGNATRSAGKIFKETKCIYVGSNIGSIMFIAFGIFVLFTENYTLQIVIRGYGSLSVIFMVTGLLFYPKFKAVYNLKIGKKTDDDDDFVDSDGLNQKERELKRQYEANVKDPNGKELLLLFDAVIKELAYRSNMKMLSIELKDVDLLRCLKLLDDVKKLVPQPLQDEYNKKKSLNLEQMNKLQNDNNQVNKPNDPTANQSRSLLSADSSNNDDNNGNGNNTRKKGDSLPSKSDLMSDNDANSNIELQKNVKNNNEDYQEDNDEQP